MKWNRVAGILLCLSLMSAPVVSAYAQQASSVKTEKGVPESLATHRQKVLSNVLYQLHFQIPPDRDKKIEASETLRFDLEKDALPLQLDFKETPDHLKTIEVNGTPVTARFRNEHIVVEQRYLKPGANTLTIHFTAGQLSLNRNDDFLYTLLVPDRARTLFPCFDQPNIKARYQLSLELPKEWTALGNGLLQDSAVHESTKTYHYQVSDRFPTYLFSFVAGRFEKTFQEVDGRPMSFLYRETDSNKIRLSTDTIFGLHAKALRFLEAYTQIPFPFQKLDFAAIPDFQYGGMEHVGAIDYKASTLFLDSGATKDQENARSNLVAHETSHMWFGDLVTMQWFNDVWMKEVFANFMADKITRDTGYSYELKFLTTHFPRAYAVDRTMGANPIRQPLSNLQEAGTLYGAIIYDKAPVMMRQLERLMGADAFRDGLREYLKTYSFGNATWPDLIKILDERTPADLQAWNKVWVNTPGRPQLNYSLQQKGPIITRLTITQKGEQSTGYVLPQFFEIALVYAGHVEEVTVNMNQQQVTVKEAEGKQVPVYILFNSSGQGYGLFPVDKHLNTSPDSLSVTDKILKLQNPVMRASAYINWYENLLSGKSIKPLELLTIYRQLIALEPEELNLSLMAGHISDIYGRLLTPSQKTAVAATLADDVWKAMQKETVPNKKKILFRTFQGIAYSKSAMDSLYAIWKEQKPPAGVKLSEEDYTSLALSLTVKGYSDTAILKDQVKRITNPDRKARLQFLLPAVSADVKQRDVFFASLKDQRIRKKEAWVAEALGYLHHPLHAATSIRYIKPSLEMLQEVQLTGDIFFPGAWLGATLGPYQSKEAATIVRSFLKAHPHYNPRLRAKILQAADPLFRAEKLVK
jgi:aminopeptidase N